MATSTTPKVRRIIRKRIPIFAGFLFLLLLYCQITSIQLVSVFLMNPEVQVQAWIPPAQAQEIAPQAKFFPDAGSPVRLKIPSLKVDAPIGHVGVSKNGAMGVPQRPSDTAWYKLGPKPGERGSAVIAGHLDWLYGAKGVFGRLNTLKPGDKISVQDDKGKTVTFVVRGMREFDPKEDTAQVFRSYDGKAYLNLVTCSGVWNRVTKSYSKRLVVFTEMVVDR